QPHGRLPLVDGLPQCRRQQRRLRLQPRPEVVDVPGGGGLAVAGPRGGLLEGLEHHAAQDDVGLVLPAGVGGGAYETGRAGGVSPRSRASSRAVSVASARKSRISGKRSNQASERSFTSASVRRTP